MASETRHAPTNVNSFVKQAANGEQAQFFQLVRMLERVFQLASLEEGTKFSGLGEDGLPKNEVLKFKGNYSFAFGADSVEELREIYSKLSNDSVVRYDVEVNFMGLGGSPGVLPQHYTRLIMERLKQRDRAMADFFDMFNHRLISLFYRAWVKYRFAAQYEVFQFRKKKDPFTRVIESLSGQYGANANSLQNYYSGHFSRSHRTAGNLQLMLSDFLRLPVKVFSFVGQWLSIAPQDRAMLTTADHPAKQRLGSGIILGKRCWDVQNKVAIEIGPINYEEYCTSGPETEAYKSLCKLINSYLPIHLAIDINFRIRNNNMQMGRLGRGAKLQENLWLQSRATDELTAKLRFHRNS